MPARALPNLGLMGFFDLGEDGWDDEMSLNLLKLSVLVQPVVLDLVAAEPGAPALGDVVVLDETHATHPNEIAVWDGAAGEEAWVYIEPVEGWKVYSLAAGEELRFDGAAWIEANPDVGGPSVVQDEPDAAYDVAAIDMGKYIRLTGGAAKTINVRPEATEALPANGEWHFRNTNIGDATFVEGSGVTVNPPNGGTLVVPVGGTVTLKRVAADEFDLLGQTVAA